MWARASRLTVAVSSAPRMQSATSQGSIRMMTKISVTDPRSVGTIRRMRRRMYVDIAVAYMHLPPLHQTCSNLPKL